MKLTTPVVLVLSALTAPAADLRVGLIGLDTSHVVAFTQLLNDPARPDHVPGGRVVAAFKGGSPDLDSSRSRVDGYTRELREKWGVTVYPTIDELCRNVDAVMLESVDGRPHLAQAIPVILARKPLFIDKPMAASLRDVIAIFRLAREFEVPVFSSSSLRYGRNTQAVRNGAVGRVQRAETTSPCSLEPSHPDLFWYGIHGVESLFTVMGTGCENVRYERTSDGRIQVTGTWRGGRTGVYREDKGYGGTAQGETGEMAVGAYDGYAPLVVEVIEFFRTGVSPVSRDETIELFAFMEAADESKRRNGDPVSLSEIYALNGYQPAPQTAAIDRLFLTPAGFEGDLGSYRSPLRFKDGRQAQSAEDWAARRREILEHWHSIMGRWPPRLESPRLEVLRTETRDELTQRRVRVQIAQDQTVEGWLLEPPGPGPLPAVLVPYYEPETSAGLNPNQSLRDFGWQLAQRGFVTLSIGSPGGDARQPDPGLPGWQPLSYLAYVAANCHTALAQWPGVDPTRIGIVGHSYGGKWALFAACLHEPFACCAVSDPGIVWDESRPNVNYWEPWYLGRDPQATRQPGRVTSDNPRTGAYKVLLESGDDLHELHALLAPRPFFVSGGSEDPPERWRALNHTVAVNRLLGFTGRVGMSNRPTHAPTEESNAQIYAFFERWLKR